MKLDTLFIFEYADQKDVYIFFYFITYKVKHKVTFALLLFPTYTLHTGSLKKFDTTKYEM